MNLALTDTGCVFCPAGARSPRVFDNHAAQTEREPVMYLHSRLITAIAVVALAALAACPKGGGVPGAGGLPGGGNVTGGLGGACGEVDTKRCGNYAGLAGGVTIHELLEATSALE